MQPILCVLCGAHFWIPQEKAVRPFVGCLCGSVACKIATLAVTPLSEKQAIAFEALSITDEDAFAPFEAGALLYGTTD